MKFKEIIICVTASIILLSCTNSEKTTNTVVTQKSDYESFLQTSQDSILLQVNNNLSFWKDKLQEQPNQYPYLSKIASVNTELFNITGDISFLKEAEKNLVKINNKKNSAGYLRSLARNYISQHRFQEALFLLKKAEKNGENLSATQKMLFDVYLELGRDKLANQYLTSFRSFTDFDYLIRAAKWNDHIGDLTSAIDLLEKALTVAKSKKNKNLIIWSYTNLADFYGHNNQIKKSYNYYLKSLEIDPNNAYAKKGIAWIVYSHEKNPKEALRILETIKKQNLSPDYSLLKAEIFEYLNKTDKKEQHLNTFLSVTENEAYGVMYHSHRAKVLIDEFDKKEKALKIIQEEITNRPTPQSYDLLAWATYKKGNVKESLSIANKYVVDKSFEPEILYHLAEIYKANKLNKKVLNIKKQLLESSYELGPLMYRKIQKL